MTSVAEWSAATKQYGTITAVSDVSLALELGEVIALVGHNGAGKTTLIKLLLGLIRPTAGTVRLLGADPASRGGADARLGIGFLPESIAFHGSMTGLELMDFYSRLKGQPRRANRDLLARVGLTEAANRRVGTYSKGMRQRLGIAQALIGDPKLLIFDEPTSGLDPASRSAVYAMIGELRAAGTTVLICTHALSEVEHLVDRVAVMHAGRLLAADTMADLHARVNAEARILLRVHPCTTGRVLERLGDTVRCRRRTETSLELVVGRTGKMSVLAGLAGMRDLITDIEITAPRLEDLYHQLVEGTGGGQ
jgi:Cu-processing system ATP-binding protein